MTYTVAAFYKFTPLADFNSYRVPLLDICGQADVFGTILLAVEGVNGTIAGSRAGVDRVLAALRALPGCADLEHKESRSPAQPFERMKVRLKKEIVTMGVDGLDIAHDVGEYVEPEDWNSLISDPEVIVIDTRNDYEVGIGAFQGAIDPGTHSFREFPQWFREFAKDHRGKKIAMYCTGGIRCEKATSFVRNEGFEEVYHLKGGILKYLEVTQTEDSLWDGQCYVFDGRVSVGHGLQPGEYEACNACGRPLAQAMKESPYFVDGVSCPSCHDQYSEARRQRFAERQRQFELAATRGKRHLGPQTR
ncbi:MAG: rhodanese-related sulfurtransferase [Parvularculaceae bacterium]